MGIFPSKSKTAGSEQDKVCDQSAKNTSLCYADVLQTSNNRTSSPASASKTKKRNRGRHKKTKKRSKRQKTTSFDGKDSIASFTKPREQNRSESRAVQSNKAGLAFSEVSREKISAYVADVLKDPSQNIWLVPDRVEGALYESAIQIAVGAIAHVLESARVELLGHEIRFILSPIKNDVTHNDASLPSATVE